MIVTSEINEVLPFEDWKKHETKGRPFSICPTYLEPDNDYGMYAHCHMESELFYLKEGFLNFHAGGRAFRIDAGDGVFIPPKVIHSADRKSRPNPYCEYHALVFSDEAIKASLPSYGRKYLMQFSLFRPDDVYPIYSSDPKNKALLDVMKKIPENKDLDIEECELTVIGMILECWQHLHNLYFSKQRPASDNSPSAKSIQRSIEFMQKCYFDQISLKDMAASANLSESHFCRCFKEYVGATPFSWLNKIRIGKSCDYLITTDTPITQIAALCGFNNINYFNHVFKELMGVSPSQYRRSARLKG